MAQPNIVTTITPLRLSFAGGGTDLPAFYRERGGAVINSTVNQYVYVTVKKHSPLFQERYRLSYSQTEHASHLDELENGIARECLRLVDVDFPLYISTAADIPTSSGLGSSSSFAVGLLHALHLIKGESVSAGQLAEEACYVEIESLKNPIGKQDQYAAAFGGLNYFAFDADDRVKLDSLVMPEKKIERLFDDIVLIWSGVQREASKVLAQQNKNIKNCFTQYDRLLESVEECRSLLLEPPSDVSRYIGAMLERSWLVKRQLATLITNNQIDRLYKSLKELGAYGGKVSGAGGGGFLFLMIPKSRQRNIVEMLGQQCVLKVKYEPRGSREIYRMY
jgi:D-glycero-alpha-D-manno-heptose-7-phosphate kinase